MTEVIFDAISNLLGVALFSYIIISLLIDNNENSHWLRTKEGLAWRRFREREITQRIINKPPKKVQSLKLDVKQDNPGDPGGRSSK